MSDKKPNKLFGNEEGFASIVIAIVMILVLSLITVGFASLMRKEERNALDKQLKTQAFYAAETGINDAAKALNAGFGLNKSSCAPLPTGSAEPGATYLESNIAGDSDISTYTCLLIDPNPPDLQYSSIPFNQSKTLKITGVNPADNTQTVPIDTLEISWQNSGGGDDYVTAGGNSFDTTANWTHTGVLRVGITPLVSGGISRDSLIASNYVAFLYPSTASALPNSYVGGAGDSSGQIINGGCDDTNTPRHCKVSIKDLSQVNYVLSLRSIYKNVSVTIKAYGFDGTQLDIKNAQTLVDSTGKAQDVLKRLQVRIPTHNDYDHSDYGLETMGNLCKQLQLLPAAAGPSTNDCTP